MKHDDTHEPAFVRPRIDSELLFAWNENLKLKELLEGKQACLGEIGRLLTLAYLDVPELKRTILACLKGEY